MDILEAPFTYFGGKRDIAPIIWNYLGDVKYYVEPFYGSGAVLLNRPEFDYKKHIEIVSDIDGNICNTWRALQFAPDEVAKYCDYPVNHIDLETRKIQIGKEYETLIKNLVSDDTYCNPKLAGFYIYIMSISISPTIEKKYFQSNYIPESDILSKRPSITKNNKVIVNIDENQLSKKPFISHSGMGISKTTIRDYTIETDDPTAPYSILLYKWFRKLAERLRYVKVCFGDWSRVCSGDWQQISKYSFGYYFDPPYSSKLRQKDLYYKDSMTIAKSVRDWCIKRGKDSNARIVLSGYYDEHKELLEHNWSVKRWTTQGGYGNMCKNTNRFEEAIFISPNCIMEGHQDFLFDL